MDRMGWYASILLGKSSLKQMECQSYNRTPSKKRYKLEDNMNISNEPLFENINGYPVTDSFIVS